MESKHRFWKGVLVGALVTVFAGLIIVGMSTGIIIIGRTVIDRQTGTQEVESGNDKTGLDMERITAKIGMLQNIISEYYLFDEDMQKVEDGIYMGLMYGLNDPYSVYYSAEDYSKLMETTSGTYSGIGMQVSQNLDTGIVTVVKVFKGTPGFEAGILPGDMIYKVDGQEVAGLDLDLLVSSYIKGKEGTSVTITMLRPSTGEYIDFSIERKNIEVPTVEYELMEDNIGYVAVSNFESVTAQQFETALESLQDQGMERLIIDLRNNPGGVLDGVVEMLAYILPEADIVYTADKNGHGTMYKSENGNLIKEPYPEGSAGPTEKIMPDKHELKMPMVVLVNGNSASASEVFTGAVKDHKWARVVGTATFGKGIVQNVIPLDNGTAIKLTTSHYFTPNGFDLHGKGIEPDVKVELDEELRTKAVIEKDEDNQLQRALEEIKEMDIAG